MLCLFQTSIANAVDPSLVGWWKFDEGTGTIAFDSSGNDNDGVFVGDPKWVPGQLGGALEFNGDDYLNCGNGPSLQIRDEITIAFWFKVEAFSNRWEAFMAKGDDSYRISRADGTGNATHMGISGTSAGGGNGWFNGTVIVTDNQWHHMAATYNGAEAKIYIDGVLDVRSPGTGRINESPYDLYIGENSQENGRFLHGLLDDMRIYSRVLTEAEILGVMTGVGEEFPFASTPVPEDDAYHLYTWVNLSWQAGDFAVAHDVYFGDNFYNVKLGTGGTFQGNQTSTLYILGFPGYAYPDGLVPGTTYYWRIDEVEQDGNTIHKGDVWSFSISPNAVNAPRYFSITYYDNYNYDTGQWDAWQSAMTPQDAWDDKYLVDGSSGNTVYTDHAFTSITEFDLRGSLFSKDGHESGGEDWNPIKSIGDNVSGQSAHHVFAAVFKGLIYLEEGDVFSVASDDDVYIFLDDNTAWGQEVLSVPLVSFFSTDSTTVTAAQAGYHMITVKYIERLNDHSGIEITLNGEPLQSAQVGVDIESGPLSEALDTTLGFTTGGDADWLSQTAIYYHDGDAAQSGGITDDQESWLQTSVNGAGTVSFFWKVSSEGNYDCLEFYIDGTRQDHISGSEDWHEMTYDITDSALHTLEWRYFKDSSMSRGDDCGWVDKVEWVSN